MDASVPEQIGNYAITREIGRGGMGVVYLARDTKLDREVAIKALPEELAQDEERLQRFEREAKLLASLNHPNIASVHGLEEVDGTRYLVLEYVEGETLEERLRKGAIPVDEALPIATQIAEAIEAAHDKGIIHRDLKPANIKFTSEEQVKVLDFGLAKAIDDRPSSITNIADSPTVVQEASPTLPGVILGTAGYLSPEQARGRPVDKRTDIFSFGCVLYEMLTGLPPFPGETATDSIGATLYKDVAFDQLPPSTPIMVRRVLRRCLERERNKRLRDIGDARLEIEAAMVEPTSASLRLVAGDLPAPSLSKRWLGTMTIILVTAVIGAGLLIRGALDSARETTPDAAVTRFTIDLPPGARFASDNYGMIDLAVSQDGRTIAFVVERENDESEIVIRDIGSFETRSLPGTRNARKPFFKPDGRWLGFFSDDRLMKVPLGGGSAITICSAKGSRTGAWLDDDTIVFIRNVVSLMQVNADGGEPTQFASIVENTHLGGALSITGVPGDRTVLVAGWHNNTIEGYDIVAVSLDTTQVTTVIENAVNPFLLESGYLVFQRISSLFAARFDPNSLAVTGPIVPVLQGVATTAWADDAQAFASPAGTLVYLPGDRHGPGRRLAWIDRQGNMEPISERVDAFVGDLRFSPDGTMLTMGTLRNSMETWVYELARDVMILLPSRVGGPGGSTWSPDGQRIAGRVYDPVTGLPDGLRIHSLSHLGEPQAFLKDLEWMPQDWTDDGLHILLTGDGGEANAADPLERGLAIWNPEGNQPPEIVIRGLEYESQTRLSADGEWIVFEKTVSGTDHIFVRRFPVTGEEWQVSADGGTHPEWSPNADEIYFYHEDAMMAARVTTGDDFSAESPVKLFDAPWETQSHSYDVAPDGRFVVIQLADWELKPVDLHIVLNWDLEIERRFADAGN